MKKNKKRPKAEAEVEMVGLWIAPPPWVSDYLLGEAERNGIKIQELINVWLVEHIDAHQAIVAHRALTGVLSR